MKKLLIALLLAVGCIPSTATANNKISAGEFGKLMVLAGLAVAGVNFAADLTVKGIKKVAGWYQKSSFKTYVDKVPRKVRWGALGAAYAVGAYKTWGLAINDPSFHNDRGDVLVALYASLGGLLVIGYQDK